ncbi:hypothetical protein [Miltoncostaea marina]|uniref:hypothetical protein n=1 Tax=Miltoncostaea marina TaxID=2843215 RepID=UPI001C3DBD19|nr:hypothetical protein [Miltoncostaea marina]
MSELNDAESRRALAARQRRMALQLARSGESPEAIAARLGVTRAEVRKMVAREARSVADESHATDRRIVHAEALMELWRTLYTPAVSGDMQAIDRFLRVEERLARLLALDLVDHLPAQAAATASGGADAEQPRERVRPADDALTRRFVRT